MNWLLVSVAVWWICNVVSTIASKTVMLDVRPDQAGGETAAAVLPKAFRDLRWLDLTLLQHAVGAMGAWVWLVVVRRGTLFPANTQASYGTLLTASAANALGNLATNASFAAVSSSMTQVVKSCEPLFTMALTLVLYREGATFGCSALASVLTMVTGVSTYLYTEASFNMWGLAAAVVSDIAFPLRNIQLKKAGATWESPLQKFGVMSILSVLMLSPLVSLKVMSSGRPPYLQPAPGLTSAGFHFLYNAASVGVLRHCTPVTHAVLNLSKRVFVIVSNLAFFRTPVSGGVGGLVLFFSGLALFQFDLRAAGRKLPDKRLAAVVVAVALFLALGGGGAFHTFPRSLSRFPLAEHRHTTFRTAWVYERPMQERVVRNIAALHAKYPASDIEVHCGNSHCVSAVQGLGKPTVSARFLEARELFRDTPLTGWLARHPLYKILAGRAYEDHLQEAVRLALLWHRGGVFFDPLVELGNFTEPPTLSASSAWVGFANGTGGRLGVARFPPHHQLVGNLTADFALGYAQEMSKAGERWPVVFDFRRSVEERYAAACSGAPSDGQRCPGSFQLNLGAAIPPSRGNSFSAISYERRAGAVKKDNIGDEVQSIAAVHLLPLVDRFLERDCLYKAPVAERTLAFLNAWWAAPKFDWPPPQNVDPLLLSMHMNVGRVQEKFLQHASYLRQRAPVGTRDTTTLAFLQRNNIEAFFSGCMTLFTANPYPEEERGRDVYINDVKAEYEKMIPERVRKDAKRTHHSVAAKRPNKIKQFRAAYEVMDGYARARLVITQRIHCALPCVAMGVPVIFISSGHMPGGGGTSKAASIRVQGLTGLFHTLDGGTMSRPAMAQWLRNFDWDHPPPNPGVATRMKLRASSWNVIRQRPALYDSARKLGLLPLPTPPSVEPRGGRLTFHTVIPGASASAAAANDSARPTVRGLPWSTWRSLESVLHHHPLAKIVVHHSGSVDLHSRFLVLTEAAYAVEVRLLDARATGDGTAGRPGQQDQIVPDRVKLEILLAEGGVYFDAAAVLTRPLDASLGNVFIPAGDSGETLAFMKFDRGHPFLRAALKGCARESTGATCGQTMAATLKGYGGDPNSSAPVVSLARENSMLSFNRDNLAECLDSTKPSKIPPSVFLARVQGIQTHKGALKAGTLCKRLFNSFCVLCNEMY